MKILLRVCVVFIHLAILNIFKGFSVKLFMEANIMNPDQIA